MNRQTSTSVGTRFQHAQGLLDFISHSRFPFVVVTLHLGFGIYNTLIPLQAAACFDVASGTYLLLRVKL